MNPYPRWNDVTNRFEIVRDLNGEGTERELLHLFPGGTTNAACCAAYDQWVASGGESGGTLPGGAPLNGGNEP